jgi:hypothetical protein
MSLRNRARAVQKKTGLSYQQALNKLRELGERPAALSKQTGWALEKCDRYLIDGHAPIDVIETPLFPHIPSLEELVVRICEMLQATCGARAVVVAAKDGRILAHIGADDTDAVLKGVFTRSQLRRAAIPVPRAVATKWSELPDVWELEDGIVLFTARFKGGTVVVKFHRDETSLGLVRLRTARAVEELERIFASESKSPGVPPVGGGSGPGGLPAEVRVIRDTRDPPPPPKKKPIGKRKKR